MLLLALARSHWGLILRAIRGDEATCQAAGINVTFYKIASLADQRGASPAPAARSMRTTSCRSSPQLFAVVTSITIITMVYVGGMASIYGAGRRRDPAGAADRTAAQFRRMAPDDLQLHADPDPVLPARNGLIAPTWRRMTVPRCGRPGMSALLEVPAVTKHFGGLHAVKDVSFTVEPGEIVGILGPNGAGKTTLYNLLTGFIAARQRQHRCSTVRDSARPAAVPHRRSSASRAPSSCAVRSSA